MNEERLVAASAGLEEEQEESSIRPRLLREYVGQREVRENLSVYIEAARGRGEALDHCLLAGPPGLGKTTLAHIIAGELSSGLHVTSGPAIQHKGDLAGILTKLNEGDVLFIDEIHRLPPAVEEALYPAMEDFAFDYMVGEGAYARSMRLPLKRFTLIGATTRAGLLTNPMRDRFGIQFRLDYYGFDELSAILTRAAGILGVEIASDGASEIARRSRGTPRIALRLLRRVRDFAQVGGKDRIDRGSADKALERLKVDQLGLDALDRQLLLAVIEKFGGGPVGIETLAALCSEERGTLEEVVEPFLLQAGLLVRTPRGRMVTAEAYRHLGLTPPPGLQGRMF